MKVKILNMANISSSELRSVISGIMKGADLTALSSKKIRNQLEKKYKVDLTARKQEIDKIVMSFVEGSEDSSEEENNEPSDSRSSSSSESEDEEQPPTKKAAPPPKTKKDVMKKGKTSNPKKMEHKIEMKPNKTESNSSEDSSSNEMDDAAVAKKLQEEEFNFRHRAAKKMPKEPSRKKKKNDGSPKVRKGTSLYTRKCTLSPELAEIMEADEMARPDVVKKMYAIVKERNLLDPSNKQFALCDEQLKKIFGAKRVRMFGMMKHLRKHIKDIKN